MRLTKKQRQAIRAELFQQHVFKQLPLYTERRFCDGMAYGIENTLKSLGISINEIWQIGLCAIDWVQANCPAWSKHGACIDNCHLCVNPPALQELDLPNL
jgi:hypothetical protein